MAIQDSASRVSRDPERAPVVWRIQTPPARLEAERDYSSCRGYGEMRTLLEEYENPSHDLVNCYQKVYQRICDEWQDGDYVLWAGGDPASAFILGVALNSFGAENINWLRWDRRTNEDGSRSKFGYYTPVELP